MCLLREALCWLFGRSVRGHDIPKLFGSFGTALVSGVQALSPLEALASTHKE